MNFNSFCMPNVGDHLMRTMTVPSFGVTPAGEEHCVVIHVNPRKKCYTVQFIETGIRETYKVPDVDEIQAFKQDYKHFFGREPRGIYVFESGMLYDTIEDCAKDLDVMQCVIIKHFRGDVAHVNGYHIYDFT